MQVTEVLIGLVKLPDWIGITTLWLLVVGFPIAVIFSWFYEITPEGISLEKDVDRADSITHVTGRRLDFIVISLLCAAVILFAYDKWWMRGPPPTSIAVLPFVNMSDDVSNEYFSDGISEELLNLLAKVPELRVISRSSAFTFKGQNIEIQEIARRLNVAHVLEGSVRKSGNTIRITAQLIEARSDTHLWSETWDRELDDIFAVQDEIAAAVVKQLKVELLGEAPKAKEVNSDAFALHLQARYLGSQNTVEGFEQSIVLNQQALAIDASYAAAWIGLANAYAIQVNHGTLPPDEGYELAREATNKALELEPDFAPAHAALGLIASKYDGDLEAAARYYEKALALEPTNAVVIRSAAILANYLGRVDIALALTEYGVTRDPVNSMLHANLGSLYRQVGRLDEAIASLDNALMLSPRMMVVHSITAYILMAKGEPEAALAEMHNEASEGWRLVGLPLVYRALGRREEADAALAELISTNGNDWPYNIAYVFADRGEADLAFTWLNRAVAHRDSGLGNIVNEPLFANIHNDPRWLPFLRKLGKAPEQLAEIKFEVTIPR
jgi:TolB-like protein/Flp pilus assembly protein TadD